MSDLTPNSNPFAASSYFGLDNLNLIQTIIETQGDPNVRNAVGDTPLHYTAIGGIDPRAEDLARKLLAMGADPNAVNKDGMTPAALGCLHGCEPGVMSALMEGGANPSAPDPYGDTPLHVLVDTSARHPETMEVLLRSGANPNAQDVDGFTPLHILASSVEMDVRTPANQALDRKLIEELLEHGADPSIKNTQGVTPSESPVVQELIHKRLAATRLQELEARSSPGSVDPRRDAPAEIQQTTLTDLQNLAKRMREPASKPNAGSGIDVPPPSIKRKRS